MHGIASLLLKTQLKKYTKKQCSECQRHYVEMSQYRKSRDFLFSTNQAACFCCLNIFIPLCLISFLTLKVTYSVCDNLIRRFRVYPT